MQRVIITAVILGGLAVSTLAQEPTLQGFKKTGSVPFDETVMSFIKKEKPKIIGGVPAKPGAYPWQVSLEVSSISDPGRAHFCGGSIYNERWIVTAAHCLTGVSPSQFNIVAGTNALKPGVDRHAVTRRIIHRDYEVSAPSDSDIALIELEKPLTLGATAKAIAVLNPNDENKILVSQQKLVVTGWGATDEGGGVVRDLREVTVPFVTNQVCADPLSYGNAITDTMICAGLAAGGKDSCQGDSGGPLVNQSSPLLVGVVSWGEGCARPGKYGVYTRISKFKPWIESCTSGGDCPARP